MHEPPAGDESTVSFLEKAFHSIENMTNDTNGNGIDAGDHGQLGYTSFQQGCLHAEIRGLRAKLRIVKEHMEQVLCDYYKKEMQNRKSSQNESANHTADKEMEEVKTELNNIKQVNKMHFADDKLLSFTKQEFKKALNWENFESHIP